MLFEIITYLFIFIFRIILIIQDWKSKTVNLFPTLGFLVSCVADFIVYHSPICLYPVFIFSIIGLFYQLILRKKAFGIADYIIVFAISFILPNNYWSLFIIMIGIFGILIAVIRQEKKIPFIPALIFSIFLLKACFLIKN